MSTPKPLDCRNCGKWLGSICPETSVALPCGIVTEAVEQALGKFKFERGLDTSSDSVIAGRFTQLRTFQGLRLIGEQACMDVLASAQITV